MKHCTKCNGTGFYESNAATHECECMMPILKFSVLLLYPDYLAETYGDETYFTHVKAPTVEAAIKKARAEATRANKGYVEDPADFGCLLVIEGHHKAKGRGL